MIMFEFMVNTFYLFCGIVCVLASAVAVFSVAFGIAKAIKRGGNNGRH